MRCGLLGEKLGHSYSPAIHAKLGDYEYRLYEKKACELEEFLKSREFDGLNVTIPYKERVMQYLDDISESAGKIGCVNTILVREDGSLYGDNTDIYGFKYMLKQSKIDVVDKKVLILGSGGTSKTALFALRELGAGEVVVISRNGEDNYNNITKHNDADIIINTTPVGMYPNNGKSATDISLFTNIKGIADVIYNPARTEIMLKAEELGVPCAGGLNMLVAQAKRSAEIWMNTVIPDEKIEDIVRKLEAEMSNIILIGMPGCGKSTIARILSKELNMEFIDADEMIVKDANMSIPEIFEREGELGFRRRETEILRRICKMSGKIIATGGGCVTQPENYNILRQNGKVIYIKRRLDKLAKKGRPLSQTTSIDKMFMNRKGMYEHFSDFSVWNEGKIGRVLNKIINKLY